MSALSFWLENCRSRSHCLSDLFRRYRTIFSKPPMVVEPFRRTGNSSITYISMHLYLKRYRGRSLLVAHELVGLKVVSELATRTHSSRGKTWTRYATAARHCGSMEGRQKAGPQMWSSRSIADWYCSVHFIQTCGGQILSPELE